VIDSRRYFSPSHKSVISPLLTFTLEDYITAEFWDTDLASVDFHFYHHSNFCISAKTACVRTPQL